MCKDITQKYTDKSIKGHIDKIKEELNWFRDLVKRAQEGYEIYKKLPTVKLIYADYYNRVRHDWPDELRHLENYLAQEIELEYIAGLGVHIISLVP